MSEDTVASPETGEITLSDDQANALDRIVDWYDSDEQVFRMFGPAGTGKTTIAKQVPGLVGLTEPGSYFFGAYSGKAASVLTKAGCNPARTLHSLLYGQPLDLKKEVERIKWIIQNEELTTDEVKELRAYLASLENRIRARGRLEFGEVNRDTSPLLDADLIIADEVSMVDDKMAQDILSFDCKVLVLGDPFQLPPIHGEGWFTRIDPDVLLTDTHRFEMKSVIGKVATALRTGSRPGDVLDWAPRTHKWDTYDQILTWKRATRWAAVDAYRSARDRPPGIPVPDDKVICIANNRDLGIFNGQPFTVQEVHAGRDANERRLTLIEEGTGLTFQVRTYLDGFTFATETALQDQMRKGRTGDRVGLFTFAQALTVHKAQGSQWGSVLVKDETPSMWHIDSRRYGPDGAAEQARRWLYTAVTRARHDVAVYR